MDLTFEREDGAQADSLATHVEAFTRTAADAFEAADEHALFNEAADYARAKGLRAYQMSQILGRLHRHPTAQAAARAWSREGSVELGEVADQARVDAVVNEVLQEHTAAAIDWPHADLCRELKVRDARHGAPQRPRDPSDERAVAGRVRRVGGERGGPRE